MAAEIFMVFDTDTDGVVWFTDVVKGLDVMERGDFDQKLGFVWSVYDIYSSNSLDLLTLRELIKVNYS